MTTISVVQILNSISVQSHLEFNFPLGFKKIEEMKHPNFTIAEANLNCVLNNTFGNFNYKYFNY